MEVNIWSEKLTQLVKKYRYAALILAVGLVLMLLPSGNLTTAPTPEVTVPTTDNMTQEQRLEMILSAVSGAGKVQVLLSCATGERTTYQTDLDTNGDAHKSDTVTVTDQERNQTGLIVQVNPPAYLGAIVVCQGADDPAVRLAIVDAVSKYTGLGANQISVLKMK